MKKNYEMKMERSKIFDKGLYNNFQVIQVDFVEKRSNKKPKEIPCMVISRRLNEYHNVDIIFCDKLNMKQKRTILNSVHDMLNLSQEKQYSVAVSLLKHYWEFPRKDEISKAEKEEIQNYIS